MSSKTLRVCKRGHRYYKSSDCPTCPQCEADKRPKVGFQALLSAPARRALASQSIQTLRQLATYTEQEILALHGIGPTTLPILRAALKAEGLSFKK